MNEIGYLETTIDTIVTDNPYLVGVEGGTGPIGELGPRGPVGPTGPVGPVGVSSESLYAQDAFKDLLQHPPLIDIDFDDGIYATKRGPLPAFSRNTSGLFMNRDGVLVGKTTSSTSINLSTTTVGSTITVTIPSRAAVDWQLGSTVLLLSDTDADNQIDAGESYISCTLLDYTLSTNTLSLLINVVGGSSTISSWAVGYCGPRLDYSSVPKRSNNLLLNSENFTSVWSLQNTFSPFGTNPSTSSISNVGISPDNAFNATRITEVSDSAAGKTILRQYFPVETSRTYTFSVYAKYGDPPAKLTDPDRRLRYLALHSFLDTTVENAATFDLLNGVVGTSTRGTGLIGRTMTPVGDDWYRCSITFKTPSSTPWNFVDIRFHDTDVIDTDITTRNYRYMYIYGAQLEIGSTPTQYTKTTSYEINTVCGGALIEESRTNLVTQSGQMHLWGGGGTRVLSTENSPDGINKATLLTSTSGAYNGLCRSNNISYTLNTQYTVSAFVKKGNWRYVSLDFSALRPGGPSVPFFDLDALKFSANGSTTVGNIIHFPNGWMRLVVTGLAVVATGTTVADFWLTSSAGTPNTDIGAGQTAYVWGYQVETGAAATSLIPTTTATAIRASDDVAYTGTTLSDLWNKSEGTIVCEFDTAGKSEYNATYFNDSFIFQAATDQSNRIGVLADGVGNISPEILAAGVNQYVPTTKKYIENSVQRVAVSFKSGSPTRAYLTGSSYVTGTNLNATLPSITTLVLGKSEISSNYLNGHLRSFRYYGKYFSENTLKFLTTSYNGSLRDIDASRYIEKVNSILQVAQGTLNDVVSVSQQDAINRFVAAGKVSGWWGRIKNLYLPIWGNGDANAVNLIDCSSGTFVGGVTHNAGWSTGDGTSGRFDYGTSPSAIGCSPTSGCIFFLLPNTTPALANMPASASIMGCADVSLTNALTISKSSASLSYVYGGTTSTTFTYVAGLHLIKRESPSGVIYQTRRSNFEDLTLGPTSAGTGISSANMNAWARNVNGSFPANSYGAYNIGLHGMGLGLSNADGSKFITDCENLWESCTSYIL
jgi:hypothetical protein